MDHQQAIATHAAERYLLNELGDADRDAFEEHYFACADLRGGRRGQAPGCGTASAPACSTPP